MGKERSPASSGRWKRTRENIKIGTERSAWGRLYFGEREGVVGAAEEARDAGEGKSSHCRRDPAIHLVVAVVEMMVGGEKLGAV